MQRALSSLLLASLWNPAPANNRKSTVITIALGKFFFVSMFCILAILREEAYQHEQQQIDVSFGSKCLENEQHQRCGMTYHTSPAHSKTQKIKQTALILRLGSVCKSIMIANLKFASPPRFTKVMLNWISVDFNNQKCTTES